MTKGNSGTSESDGEPLDDRQRQNDVLRPDLYIALVGAAGTDLGTVRDTLRAQLAVVGYSIEHIKVSDLIKQVMELDDAVDEYARIKQLMRAGDAVRATSEMGEGVASIIIAEIMRLRGRGRYIRGATAFVIDSLKNPSEVGLLERVYGRNYYTLSVYLSKEERTKNIALKIAKQRRSPPSKHHYSLAQELIVDDQKGKGSKSQNVSDTFPLADYFLNARRPLDNQIKRFVELVFEEPFTTPTQDEYFMYMAKGAGYRSADLSRQVGAVIVDSTGVLASTGCNEVPFPGGGIYFEGRGAEIEDNRDHVNKIDPNYIEIQRSLIELIGVLKKTALINEDVEDEKIVHELLQGEHKSLMSNARVRNLIEFGRIVHAEMHAICEAASSGRAIRGGKIYCTTFPCHGCARHIIAAGLHEVVYIEPYPKSLTAHLYEKETEFAHESKDSSLPISKVTFRPFHGTAPIFFQRAFRERTRKDGNGTVATWLPGEAVPSGAALSVERPNFEAMAANSVAANLEKAKAEFRTKIDGD